MEGKPAKGDTPSAASKTSSTSAVQEAPSATAATSLGNSGAPKGNDPAGFLCPDAVNEFWHCVRDLEAAAVVARWGVKGVFAAWDYGNGKLETRANDIKEFLQEERAVAEYGISRLGGFPHRPSIDSPQLFAAELRRLLKLFEEWRRWVCFQAQPSSQLWLNALANAGIVLQTRYEAQPLISAIGRIMLDLPGTAKPVLARTDGSIHRAHAAVVDAIAWAEEQVVSQHRIVPATSSLAKDALSSAREEDGYGSESFVFMKDGDGYWIEGFGEKGHVASLTGFQLLAKLVAQPGTPVPMTELLGSLQEAAEADQHSFQAAMDEEAKHGVRQKLNELDADIEAAQRNADQAAVDRLTSEKWELIEHLKASTGIGGHDRNINGVTAKQQSRIRNAIKTACNKLRKSSRSMGVLADHFETQTCASGAFYLYNPSPPITWFSEKIRDS